MEANRNAFPHMPITSTSLYVPEPTYVVFPTITARTVFHLKITPHTYPLDPIFPLIYSGVLLSPSSTFKASLSLGHQFSHSTASIPWQKLAIIFFSKKINKSSLAPHTLKNFLYSSWFHFLSSHSLKSTPTDFHPHHYATTGHWHNKWPTILVFYCCHNKLL